MERNIFIDNDPEVEDIVTDLPGTYRYDKFSMIIIYEH